MFTLNFTGEELTLIQNALTIAREAWKDDAINLERHSHGELGSEFNDYIKRAEQIQTHIFESTGY